YDELVKRRGAAQISQDRDNVQSGQFRIIDPPQKPLQPSGPNRVLFLSVVLGIRLGVGIAFGSILVLLKDSISSVAGLKSAFGLAVLGTVSFVELESRKAIGFFTVGAYAVSCAGLIAVFLILLFIGGRIGLLHVALWQNFA